MSKRWGLVYALLHTLGGGERKGVSCTCVCTCPCACACMRVACLACAQDRGALRLGAPVTPDASSERIIDASSERTTRALLSSLQNALTAWDRASADLPHLVAEPHRAPVEHHLKVAYVLRAHA
jgi:hypothetical protein